jgi:hypothetical protein
VYHLGALAGFEKGQINVSQQQTDSSENCYSANYSLRKFYTGSEGEKEDPIGCRDLR